MSGGGCDGCLSTVSICRARRSSALNSLPTPATVSIGGLSHPSASYCSTSSLSSAARLGHLSRWFCDGRRMMNRVVGKCCCLNLLCSNYNDFVSSMTMEMFHTRTTSWTPIYDDLLDFACGKGK